MSLGSNSHSLALTWIPSVFKNSPEVSTKPLPLSNLAPLTSVALASAPVSISRPMTISPPLRCWPCSSLPELLAVTLPSTRMLPPSASRCTAPPCAPVVSMLPLWMMLATALLSAAACMYTCPPSVTRVPPLALATAALMRLGLSSSLMRPLPLTGILTVSAAAR